MSKNLSITFAAIIGFLFIPFWIWISGHPVPLARSEDFAWMIAGGFLFAIVFGLCAETWWRFK